MTPIGLLPEIDAYGGDSRPSAIADVLELQALTTSSMNEAQLTDYVADANWGRRWAEKFNDVGDPSEGESPTARDMAVYAFDCIEERSALLGAAYPFINVGGRVQRQATTVTSYDAILALAVSHAYSLNFGVNPRDHFEEVVLRSLHKTGVRASGVAERRRTVHEGFPELVKRVCTDLGLDGDVSRATSRRGAFDGGCDILGYFPFEPRRQSVVTAIVQVTCAQSEKWEDKLSETRVNRWKKVLRSEVAPIPLLAVPYHVRTIHLRNVEEAREGMLLDRLTLAYQLRDTITPADEAVARHLWRIRVDAVSGHKRTSVPA